MYNGTNWIVNGNVGSPLSLPLTITNSSSSPIIASFLPSSALASITTAITVNSNNIIFDGSNSGGLVVTVANFPGFIGNAGGYTGIVIQNLSITTSGGGTLANNSGWICQSLFSNGIINNCSATFNSIPTGAGGILGQVATNCIVNNCFSSGSISGNGSGGIFGKLANTNCIANNCFSTGHISTGSGGIFGSLSTSSCIANNCGSFGSIGIGTGDYNNGGIFGPTAGTSTANYCFALGNIYGDNSGSNGGIFGGSNTSCVANNCYTIGNIGQGSGGIFLTATSGIATFCYSLGNIGISAGGILSSSCSSCSVQSCYTVGNIGQQGGGIVGSSAISCIINHCYTLGSLNVSQAGSLFGPSSNTSSCSNCYVLNGTTSLFFGDGNVGTVTNCLTENGGSTWLDVHAVLTIGTATTGTWTSVSPNIPWLLSSFNNYNNTISPKGYEYSYTISPTSSITSNGTTLVNMVTGYYTTTQTSIAPTQIFGYVFNTIPLTVNVPPPPPPSVMNWLSALFLVVLLVILFTLFVGAANRYEKLHPVVQNTRMRQPWKKSIK